VITKKQAETLQKLITERVATAVQECWAGVSSPDEAENLRLSAQIAAINLDTYIVNLTRDQKRNLATLGASINLRRRNSLPELSHRIQYHLMRGWDFED
jgi:hypothetical protein